MELCSLDEAFGLISQPNPGCRGGSAVGESRKHDRKKAKKCRGPQLSYIESDASFVGASSVDPDRPAVKRMEPVPTLNPSTGLREHMPVDQDWGTNEPFVGESGGGNDLATIQRIVQGNNTLQKGKKPSYFGASPNESPGSAIPGKKNEGFEDKAAPYVDNIGQNDTLNHDFTDDAKAWQASKKGDMRNVSARPTYGLLTPELEGLETPNLPPPETVLNWRGSGPAGGQSQYFTKMYAQMEYPQQATPQEQPADVASRREVLQKMDTILSRLDDMQYINQENAQKEVLLFIMTGLGVLFVMDVACRAASKF